MTARTAGLVGLIVIGFLLAVIPVTAGIAWMLLVLAAILGITGRTRDIKRLTAVFLVPIALVLAGCTAAPSSTEPTDLTGKWSYSKDTVQFEAEVKGGDIEVYLTLDDTKGLYWSGTFENEAVDGQEISSDADTAALDESLYGSTAESKDFTFTNGELHFDFTIMGTDTDISLRR